MNHTILQFDHSSSVNIHLFTLLLIPFLGLVGDANTKCFDTSLPLPPGSGGEVGSTCIMGSNCLYSECVNGVCVAPALTCPSNVAGNTNDILFLLLPYCSCCLIIMLYPAYLRELFFAYAVFFYRFREQKTSFHYIFFRLRDGHFACLQSTYQTLLFPYCPHRYSLFEEGCLQIYRSLRKYFPDMHDSEYYLYRFVLL